MAENGTREPAPFMRLEVYRSGRAWSGHGESTDLSNLNPCPFCASTDVQCGNTHTPCYWVSCNDCCAEGPTSNSYDGKQIRTRREAIRIHQIAFAEAVSLWNEARQ